MNTFLHSGDAGDLIYALPTIKALGTGKLYLHVNNPNRNTLEDGSLSLFTKEKIKTIIPLLQSIRYIKEVRIYNGEEVKYNLDLFRNFNLHQINIADGHLKGFGLDIRLRNTAWLSISARPSEEILISRSLRYRNPNIDWDKLYRFAIGRCAFIGTKEEHKDFEENTGKIKHIKTSSLLEVAEYIAGCNIFIGNQSAPYAIAEALKKNSIQEVCTYSPNCIFDRVSAFYLWDNKTADYLKNWEQTLNKVK